MANQFCHIIVVAVFPGRVGDVPNEGHILGDVTSDINRSFQVRIIVLIVLVLPINALTQGGFQEVREHEHDEVENIFLLIVVTEVE